RRFLQASMDVRGRESPNDESFGKTRVPLDDEADTNLVRRGHVGELLRRAGGHRRDRGRAARPPAGGGGETSPENRCAGGRVAGRRRATAIPSMNRGRGRPG